MKAKKLFMYKIIISNDRSNRGYHSPTHFAKTLISSPFDMGASVLSQTSYSEFRTLCRCTLLLYSALAEPGGHHWRVPPPPSPTGSISFIFAYIFAKKCTHWRLAPPQQVGTPPRGNPGSATAVC